MQGRPKREKSEYSSLDTEFKTNAQSMSVEEIKQRVSEAALELQARKEVLKNDPDVAQAKEALKNLMEPYREDSKEINLKIKFYYSILEARGKV